MFSNYSTRGSPCTVWFIKPLTDAFHYEEFLGRSLVKLLFQTCIGVPYGMNKEIIMKRCRFS